MKSRINSITVAVFVFTAISFAQFAYAEWWNPSTWFKASNTSTSENTSNQELLQRISDLEKKVSEQPMVTPTVSVTQKTPMTSDNNLQSQIDKLTNDNSSLKSKLISIQNQLNNIQGKYASCQASLASSISTNVAVPVPISQPTQTSIPSPIEIAQKDKPFDYNNYVKVNISDYAKNPSSYLGWGTEILTVTVNDFLGAGDRGVDKNYIEITDAHTSLLTPDKMMVQFDNADDYSKVVNSLNKGDLINVYGVGLASQQFRSVGSSDSSSSYEPVIRLQRIDKCIGTSCARGNTSFVFMKAQ